MILLSGGHCISPSLTLLKWNGTEHLGSKVNPRHRQLFLPTSLDKIVPRWCAARWCDHPTTFHTFHNRLSWVWGPSNYKGRTLLSDKIDSAPLWADTLNKIPIYSVWWEKIGKFDLHVLSTFGKEIKWVFADREHLFSTVGRKSDWMKSCCCCCCCCCWHSFKGIFPSFLTKTTTKGIFSQPKNWFLHSKLKDDELGEGNRISGICSIFRSNMNTKSTKFLH